VLARAFPLTLTLVTALYVLIPPTYQTNDDPNIRRSIEGLSAPGAAPTGYVVFAPALIAWPLVAVQRVVRVHGWDVVVAGLLIWSVAIMLTNAWAASFGVAGRLITMSAALLTIFPLLPVLQFTISATLAGAAAMLTIALEVLAASPRRSVIVCASTLAFAGLLVRPLGATAGGLLALVLVMPLVCAEQEHRSRRLAALACAACALVTCAGTVMLLDRAMYGLSPAWEAFREDQATAHLFDPSVYLPTNVEDAIRVQLGWSANDWDLLSRGWGVDPTIHSHQNTQMLYATWSALVGPRLEAQWFFERALDELRPENVARLLGDARMAFVGVALIVAAAARRRGLTESIAVAALFVAACAVIEIAFKHLPFRLFGPLQACFVVAAAIVIGRHYESPPRRWAFIVAAIALMLAGVEARTMIHGAMADAQQSREVDAQVADLLQLHPSLLVLHRDSFPSEFWWRPFHTPAVKLPAIQLGTNNHNPSVEDFAERTYHDSLLHVICTDPSVLVVAEEGRLEPVTNYMAEHYETHVTWTEVYAGSFRVWRCVSTPPAISTATASR
jgi:hypothetical protein